MGKWRAKLYKTDRARDFDHERDRKVRARQVYETIDRQRFQWMVVFVAGIGFFLDGYTLFASNYAMPMIAYVYWGNDRSHTKLTWINIATLVGTMVGQVLFGVLADKRGRKKMYGVELVILIMATFGVVMASSGINNSMSVYAWLIMWRVITGVGVGADYPLSAVITSEFAPTGQRARMMAAVFAMQPLGQTAATISTMIIAAITRRAVGEEDPTRAADVMWRWIIGVGVFPAVVAIIFRMAIPETPRFLLEIEEDPVKADFDTSYLFGETGEEEELVSPVSCELESGPWMLDTKGISSLPRPATSFSYAGANNNPYYCEDIAALDNMSFTDCRHVSVLTSADWTLTTPAPPNLNSEWPLIRKDLHQYFIVEKNYITLLATSVSWLLLDIGFYGTTMSSPHWLASTWGDLAIHGLGPPWQITDASVSIYDQFIDTSLHGFVILNLGSLIGSALLILTINHLNRVKLQRVGFLFMACIFVAIGATKMSAYTHSHGPVAIALYVIAQAAFNFGPNATTFILPAELFPTRYRASCHGISAATGKFGAAIMQIVAAAAAHASRDRMEAQSLQGHVFDRDARAQRYGKIMLGFSGAMILGFIVSLWIPDVQKKVEKRRSSSSHRDSHGQSARTRPSRTETLTASLKGVFETRLRNKTLEELSRGRSDVRRNSNLTLVTGRAEL